MFRCFLNPLMYFVFCVLILCCFYTTLCECIFTEKMLAATLHFFLVSFHWAFIKFPFKAVLRFLLISVSTGADFLCCIALFVWWWQVGLGPCTFPSLKNFGRCLPFSQHLFSLLLLRPLWVSKIYLNHCSVTRGICSPAFLDVEQRRNWSTQESLSSLVRNCWRHQEIYCLLIWNHILAWQARRAVSYLRIPVSKILRKANETLSLIWDSCSLLNWSELGCGMRAQHLFSAKLGQTQSLLIPLQDRAHLGTQRAPPWGHQEFDRKSRHYSNLFFVSLSLNTPL